MTTPLDTLFRDVKARLEPTGAFGAIEVRGGAGGTMLVAAAKASADAAFYRLEHHAADPSNPRGSPGLWVSLVTPSRWLSESIESQLVEHGDDLGELVEDELVELGYEGAGLPPTFQHFRSPDLLYTFRTPLPSNQASVVSLWFLAYEQAFRRLGDMEKQPE